MLMSIELQGLFEMVFIVTILKLIVIRWQPPLQESLQAILCITIGTGLGMIFYPTKQGLITGLIASGSAFYGGDLFAQFRSVKDDIEEELSKKEKKN